MEFIVRKKNLAGRKETPLDIRNVIGSMQKRLTHSTFTSNQNDIMLQIENMTTQE